MKKIRWRLRNTEGRNAQRKRYYDKYRWGIKSQDRWEDWEEVMVLCQPGNVVLKDRVLHTILGRSVQAIQTKRGKMRKAWREQDVY